MPGAAERLALLDAAADDLLKRTTVLKNDTPTFIKALFPEKQQRKLVQHFQDQQPPNSLAHILEFIHQDTKRHVYKLTPVYNLVKHILEFNQLALTLIHELSTEVVSFSFDVNELLFCAYFELAVKYAKVNLLLSNFLSPGGCAKVALAVFYRAHQAQLFAEPSDWVPVSQFALELERPMQKLQADMKEANLRVFDSFAPLGARLMLLSDPEYLRAEEVLSPAFTPTRKGDAMNVNGNVEPLLAHLSDVRYWVVYGFLLCPEQLAEEGAVDLLMRVLDTLYVLPIYGSDYIWAHAAFDVDPKTLSRWLRNRKDVVKKFQSALKESRITAFRLAPIAHNAQRSACADKLSKVLSTFLDSPELLLPWLPCLLAILRLAQAEIEWWVFHYNAVPDGVPRRVRDEAAEQLKVTFDPTPIHALCRYMIQLRSLVRLKRSALAESSCKRLSGEMLAEYNTLASAIPFGKIPGRVAGFLRNIPSHLQYAASGTADLRGLRLNSLRIVTEMSSAGSFGLVLRSKQLQKIMHWLHEAAVLSAFSDNCLHLVDSAISAYSLVTNVEKFENVLFANAVSFKPSDCLALLELACASDDSEPLVKRCLETIEQTLYTLLDETRRQFVACRAGMTGLEYSNTVRLCAFCTAFERTYPLELPGYSLTMSEWLREHIDKYVSEQLRSYFVNIDGSPATPTEAASKVRDLSLTLSAISRAVSIDVHSILSSRLAHEFQGSNDAPPADFTRVDDKQVDGGDEDKIPEVNALPDMIPKTNTGGAPSNGVTSLRQILVGWLEGAVEAAFQPTTSTIYLPGRGSFVGQMLDMARLADLCVCIGSAAVNAMDEALIDMAAAQAAGLRHALELNREFLQAFDAAYEKSLEIPSKVELCEHERIVRSVQRMGVMLAARFLLNKGAGAAKRRVLPSSVSDFVLVLGEQLLPNGTRSTSLPLVATLLAEFGAPTLEHDTRLLEALTNACSVTLLADTWRGLPSLLAFSLCHPLWDSLATSLSSDALPGNLHTSAFAFHALLTMVEPIMPIIDQYPLRAHRYFVDVATAVFLEKRIGIGHDTAASNKALALRERSLGGIVLLLQQFASCIDPLSATLLQPHLPHALILAQYNQSWHMAASLVDAHGVG